MNTILVSVADLGEFQFLYFPQAPEPYKKPIHRSYDKLYFPINGFMTLKEGSIRKRNIYAEVQVKKTGIAYFEKEL